MKYVIGVMRPNFLLLAVACVFLGLAAAVWGGATIHVWQAVLCFVGGILSHGAVNAFNEYEDIKSGLDLKTQRTPFSGGSGTLVDDPARKQPLALWTGIVCSAVCVAIGAYFFFAQGWPILLIGALAGSVKHALNHKAAGLDLKTTELVPRDSPLPEIGVSPQVDAAAFALPAGAVGGPVDTDNAVVVIKVVEHTQPTPFELAAGREQLGNDMLTDRRERFFAAYMQKVRQRMKIEVNRENLQKVIGQ